MATIDPIPGSALKALRKQTGLSGEKAAARADWHPQTWRNYENAHRLMDQPTLERAVTALGLTMADHTNAVQRLTPPTPDTTSAPDIRGITGFSLPISGYTTGENMVPSARPVDNERIDCSNLFSQDLCALRVADMSMVPYAEPGGFVSFDPRRPARRGQGAVIRLRDGTMQIKRFERIEAGRLVASRLYPQEEELTYDLNDVEGAYAVIMRWE